MTTTTRVPPSTAVLLGAIVMTGVATAFRVSPLLWFVTPVVAWVILRAAQRDLELPRTLGADIRELPSALRERVNSAFTQLPAGDARRLLLGVVNQARLLFGRDESRFDASEEARLRDHVSGLVDACCTTAADLSRLDQFTAQSSQNGVSTDLAARAGKARELFRERLTNAAAALAELYTSNVERGTPSTDRVADLTAEISADASARSAATSEMSKLLGDGGD
jgi:hypothetical protein